MTMYGIDMVELTVAERAVLRWLGAQSEDGEKWDAIQTGCGIADDVALGEALDSLKAHGLISTGETDAEMIEGYIVPGYGEVVWGMGDAQKRSAARLLWPFLCEEVGVDFERGVEDGGRVIHWRRDYVEAMLDFWHALGADALDKTSERWE